MAATEKERVKTSLSEGRMLVLGAQILLGFRYRASFEPGFPPLPHRAQYSQLAALMLLLASAACMTAPAPHHRVAPRGHATARTERYTKRMVLLALVPFALALGMNLGAVPARQLGLPTAGCVACSCWSWRWRCR